MINVDVPENSRKLAQLFNEYEIFSIQERMGLIRRHSTVESLEGELKSEKEAV